MQDGTCPAAVLRKGHGEQFAGASDLGRAVAIGELAAVADAVEAGQGVDEEAVNDLL